jgi:hypothetical protein
MSTKRSATSRNKFPHIQPFLEDGYSSFRTEDSRCILAHKLLHLQADYIRELVNAGATDHPADIAESFANAFFHRTQEDK